MQAAYFRTLRKAASRWEALEVSDDGDALVLVFKHITGAVKVVEVQCELADYNWPVLSPPHAATLRTPPRRLRTSN